jgi:hypothetical protein
MNSPQFPNGGIEDKEDICSINSLEGCVLCSGSFNNPESVVRCAYRGWNVRTIHECNVGFRPAKTFR